MRQTQHIKKESTMTIRIKKILFNLLWVVTYPIAVVTGAMRYGSMNERLAKRPIWLVTAFAVTFFIIQGLALLAAAFSLPINVQIATGAVMALGWLVGWVGFTFIKSPPKATPVEIFGVALFWAGAASLVLRAILL